MKYLLGFLGGVVIATTVSVGAQNWNQNNGFGSPQQQWQQQEMMRQQLNNHDLQQGRNPFGPNPCR